jgi:hypothetical protein
MRLTVAGDRTSLPHVEKCNQRVTLSTFFAGAAEFI